MSGDDGRGDDSGKDKITGGDGGADVQWNNDKQNTQRFIFLLFMYIFIYKYTK